MSLDSALKDLLASEDYTLTDAEYYAVYDFAEGHKDEWPQPFKGGMLKLLNGEMHRRLFKPKS